MDSRVGTIALAVAVGVASLASGRAMAGTDALAGSLSRHVWRNAEEVPGTAALNRGGVDEIISMSCGAAGNCSTGGWYTDSSHQVWAFVDSQAHGAWGTAIKVPGTARGAQVNSVSCGAAGSCTAGGEYTNRSGPSQAFVVSQVRGTWGTAIEVPGTAALDQGVAAEITSVSCSSAGNCSAGGFYEDSSGSGAFVVSQAHGSWGTAIEVPGTAALGEGAQITSVSCSSAGNCSAGGYYTGSSGSPQAFVVSQADGTWGTAIEVPGTAALNQGGGGAGITSVSCRSPGNCSAGGYYAHSFYLNHSEAFVVSQADGTWGTAIEVPGTAALNQGTDAQISSVSCGSAGNCSAGGYYTDSSGNSQAFVVSQADGTWGTAIEVPGTAALNQGGGAEISSVSCSSAGNCNSGGYYLDSSYHFQAFVVSQVHGSWGTVIELPGIAALTHGGSAAVFSVSCASVGSCSAGGTYEDSSGHGQVFVVSKT